VVVAEVEVVAVADKDKLEAPAVEAATVKEVALAFAEFEEAAAAAAVEVCGGGRQGFWKPQSRRRQQESSNADSYCPYHAN
jgi:hypothetical protein